MSLARFNKKFKIRNPYKPDEVITQELTIGEDLFYDYSSCPWVAIDTEFLHLDMNYDSLCLIQLASPDPENANNTRVELVWVYKTDGAAEGIASILKRSELEIIMHVFSADLPRLEKFAGVSCEASVFDTKVASKIAITNTQDHGMDDIISNLVDPKFNKDKKTTQSQWDISPERWNDKMIEYSMYDVIFLQPMKQKLEDIAERRGRKELLARAMRATTSVAALYHYGLSEKVYGY